MPSDIAAVEDERVVVPRLRLGLLLWVAGMFGVGAMLADALPAQLKQLALPIPLWLAVLASVVQNALIVALAVWAGVALGPKLGLHAPVFAALVSARPIAAALRPQLLPAVIAGVLSGVALYGTGAYAPEALAAAEGGFGISLLARVLYGGLTEELLARWGMMSVLLWLAWRLLQRRRGSPRAVSAWFAIAASAVVFAVGHLPATLAIAGALTANVVAFVLGANTAFGILFGYLFWRRGLECAMLAHALAHVTSALLKWV